MKTLLLTLALACAAPSSTQHPRAILTGLEGDYVLTSRFWPFPGGEPVVTTLAARRHSVLDGRVLQSNVGPDERGFLGTGLMGFDDAKQKFWYVWTDTTTGGRAVLEGTLDEHGQGVLEGETPTPRGYAPLRVEIRQEGAVEVHEYFSPADGGATFKWLELRYERSGASAR